MKQYAYFPGCSMNSTAVTYKKSFEYVAEKIGLELKEIPDWSCCGSTAAHTKNEKMAYALAARNIAIAEKELPGLDIVTPCAACYSRLKYANYAARQDEYLKTEISEILGMGFEAKPDILNFLDLFNDYEVLDAVKKGIHRDLSGLKAACYYGCLNSRPRKVTGQEDIENPMTMDNIMKAIGVTPIDWDFKTECCGASHQVDAPKSARPLIEKIFRNAKANGAEAIVTVCPLCNMNLDMREAEINKNMGKEYDIPVYQLTELIAIALGAGAEQCGIHRHFFPAFDLVNNIIQANNEKKTLEKLRNKKNDPLADGPVIFGKAGK